MKNFQCLVLFLLFTTLALAAVTLIQPSNNTPTNSSSVTFSCNATVTNAADWNLTNITLYVWNSSGSLVYTATNDTNVDLDAIYLTNTTTLSDGNYTWTCNATEINSTDASQINTQSTSSWSLQVDTTPPTTTATAVDENGNSYTFGTSTSSSYVNVTLNCSDAGVGCDKTFYCNDTSNACTPSTLYTGTVQISTQGTSYIRYYSNDTLGNTETTKSQTIVIDTTAPSPQLSCPEKMIIRRSYTFTCSGEINTSIVASDGTVICSTTGSYCEGSYTPSKLGDLTFTCTSKDSAGNTASTSCTVGVRRRTTTSMAYIKPFDLSEGPQNITLRVGTRKELIVKGIKHKIEVKSYTEDGAIITIFSTPLTVELKIGETKELDLDENGVADLKITLNNIEAGNIDLTLEEITEAPAKEEEVAKEEKVVPEEKEEAKTEEIQKPSYGWVWAIIIVVIIAVAVSIYLVTKKKK